VAAKQQHVACVSFVAAHAGSSYKQVRQRVLAFLDILCAADAGAKRKGARNGNIF